MAIGDSGAFGKSPWGSGGSGMAASRTASAPTGYWTNAAGLGIQDPYATAMAQNPQSTYYQGVSDRLTAKAPFLSSYYDTQRAGAQSDYANSLAGLNLQQQGLGIDRGAAARDSAYYDAMKAQAGLTRANQGDVNNNNLATTGRGINSQATAAGNWFAPGRNDAIADAYKQWGTTNTAADISYRNDILGLDKSKAEVQDRNRKLDLAASQLGIDKAKLKTNLEQGMASLGYNQFMSVDQLTDALDSNNAQIAAMAQQAWQQILQAGDVYHSGQLGDQYDSYTRPHGAGKVA